MEAVSPISPVQPLRFQPVPVQAPPLEIPPEPAPSANQQITDLVNQLPAGPVEEITDAFRRINISANQSAELDQSFENRLFFQSQVDEEISTLQSLFERLNQDDLSLFIAVFQNQFPDDLFSSNRNQDDFFTSQSLDQFTPNALDSLLQIDVTSQAGSLAALALSGTIIDVLSGRNSSSGLLDSLLDDLTRSIITTRLFEPPEPPPAAPVNTGETTEAAPAEDDDTTATEDEDLTSEIEELTALDPPFAQVGSNPPTIIEIAG